MMVQTSGIKHLELKYQACNYKKKTLLLHLVFYSSVWKFPSNLKSETWRSFSRRSFVAVTWSTDVVSMRINKRIPPQHHYKDISSCRPSAGNLEIMAGQRFCQWKKKEKGGHCCVNHSGQEEHVWSAHTWSQVTFSRGLIWGSHTVVVVSKTSAECRTFL